MTLPLRPRRYINFFEPFHFTAGSDRGIAHFLTATRNTIEGVGEKKKRKKRLVLTRVQKGSYVTLCICRLTLAWVTSENSTTLLECRLIFPHCGWTLSHADWSLCCPVSTASVRRPSPTAFLAPVSNSPLASPHLFRSRRDRGSKTLCLVSRQNRQRNRLLDGPPT